MRINKLLLTTIIAALAVGIFSLAHGRKKQKAQVASVQEKTMYTLYTIPGTCSTGIAILMQKLNIPYKMVKRSDVSDYTAIVPTNQVPALKTKEGKVIAEGGAIALYLLEKHGKELLPTNIEERAEFYQWLNFAYATTHPAYSKLFSIAGNKDLDDKTKIKVMQYLANSLSGLWAILDKRLENQQFILGDKPCHVDYMVTVYTSWNNFFPDTKITLGKNVKRLVKDVQALPEFKAGYAAEGTKFNPAP